MRTLEVTTDIGCRVRCGYCPQDKLINAYTKKYPKDDKSLTLLKFLACLKNIPKDVRIDFAGFSEPFCNDSTIKMIRYVDAIGHKVGIYTTLFNFPIDRINCIENIKFDRFVIHLKKHFKLTEHKDQFKKNLKALVDSEIDLSYVAIDEVPKDYLKIIDKGINKVELISRAGNLKEVSENKESGECLKGKEFSKNVLLPNGKVYLCCMDYGLKHRLGDLTKTNYNDLIRLPDYKLCRKCEFYKTNNKKQ